MKTMFPVGVNVLMKDKIPHKVAKRRINLGICHGIDHERKKIDGTI